ncbi:MAG: calcium-binding protein [Burkholderiales bacterium]|nr:calcium-binding protein [Burkholderiales bacterium]
MTSPVLFPSNPVLGSIDEDAPPGNGTIVAELVVDGSITDADTPAAPEAIVIESVDNSHGQWQYSVDGGSSWSAIDNSVLNATPGYGLALDAAARVRFVPAVDYNGTVGFEFHAWDGTGAASGDYVSIGGDAYSEESDIATLTVNPVSDTHTGTNSSESVFGSAGADLLLGKGSHDDLYGYGGNDRLNGGTGADGMYGGTGDDTYYVDNAGDFVFEAAGEGTDTVRSSIDYALTDNVENLVLTGTAAISGAGNTLANTLTGNAAANTLTGGLGDDTLNGRAGADMLAGNEGNDTYVVDDNGDTVVEAADEGTDLIKSSVNWTLGANLENLTLSGTAAIDGTGNSLDNVIAGNAASNVIDGGIGADTMRGGAGDDTYYVDNIGDVVQESATGGYDTVYTTVTFNAANVERVILVGNGDANITGNAQDNYLVGNDGNNVIDGRAGADVMMGGLGDDTYIVDRYDDAIIELDGQGNDTVRTSVQIGGFNGVSIENFVLTGTSELWCYVEGYKNQHITGNSAGNVLDGGKGDDTLTGAGGSDFFRFFAASGNELPGVDTITDFKPGTDKILLGLSTYGLIGTVDVQTSPMQILPGAAGIYYQFTNTSFFWQGAAAHDADDRIIYDRPTGRLMYDADGNGASQSVVIALIGTGSGHPNLTVTDLVGFFDIE